MNADKDPLGIHVSGLPIQVLSYQVVNLLVGEGLLAHNTALLPSSEVTPGLPGSYNGRKEKSAPNFYPRTAMMSVPLNRLGALLAGSLAFAAAALLIQPAEGTLTANLAAEPAASPAFPGFRMEE